MVLRRSWTVFSWAFVLTLISVGTVWSASFTVKGDARNIVRFISKATLETVKGVTSSVTASVNADLSDVTKTTGTVTVDLSSLDTGIDMRNQHMRERFLETAQFPKATFELKKVTPKGNVTLKPNQPLEMLLEGSLTIHGATRDSITVPASATLLPAQPEKGGDQGENLLHLVALLPVRLQDYRIERPEFLFMKLNENVQIEVDVFLTDKSVGK